MQGKTFRLVSFLIAIFAVVVSVDIAPDAADMLFARGKEDKDVRIENVFYSCVNGNNFAMVRNGAPGEVADYDLVEAGELRVYVPKFMSFKGDIPKIVTFPRRTGFRDVGTPNTID